jgi:hypothetical protein
MHGMAMTSQINGVNKTTEQRTTIEKMPPGFISSSATTKKLRYPTRSYRKTTGMAATINRSERLGHLR